MINLDEYKNKQSFDVPDEYFETLQKEVMGKIAKEKKFVRSRKRIITTISSVAASVLIIIGVLNFLPQSVDADMAAVVDTLKKATHNPVKVEEVPEVRLAEASKKGNKEIHKVEEVKKNAHIVEKRVIKPEKQNEHENVSIIDYYQDELIDNDYLEI